MAGSPVLASVGVFIGLLLIFNSLAGWLFGTTLQPFPTPFEGPPVLGGFVTRHDLGSTAVTRAVLACVYGYFRFTDLGLAMRAAAYNPVSTRLMGIRVDRMLALGWGLAAAIGGGGGDDGRARGVP